MLRRHIEAFQAVGIDLTDPPPYDQSPLFYHVPIPHDELKTIQDSKSEISKVRSDITFYDSDPFISGITPRVL